MADKSPQLEPVALSVQRKRALTDSIALPKPEDVPEKYTRERVEWGFQYAEMRLNSTTRKPSPNTARLLALYSGACRQLVEKHDEGIDEKTLQILASEVRHYENEMATHGWAKACPDLKEQELHDQVLELKMVQYYAKFGDYMQRIASHHRMMSAKLQTPHYEALCAKHSWSTISEKLRNEEVDWNKEGPLDSSRVETTLALYMVCRTIGTNFESVVEAIHMYASRNKRFHSALSGYMERKAYARIAEMLKNDLEDLPSIIPPGPKYDDQHIWMKAIIEDMIQQWFKVVNTWEPASWIATSKLENDCEAVSKDPKAIETHKEQTAVRSSIRIKEMEQKRVLARQALDEYDTNRLPKGGPVLRSSLGKRKGDPIEFASKTRREMFTSVQERRKSIRSSAETAIELQSTQNEIVNFARSKWGSSPPSDLTATPRASSQEENESPSSSPPPYIGSSPPPI